MTNQNGAYALKGSAGQNSADAYAIDKAGLDELIAMAKALTGYIEREKSPCKAHELREIFGYIGDILAEVERSPLSSPSPAKAGALICL